MKRREFITRLHYWQEQEVAMAIDYTSVSIARSQAGLRCLGGSFSVMRSDGENLSAAEAPVS
jgi:hypothetical protein